VSANKFNLEEWLKEVSRKYKVVGSKENSLNKKDLEQSTLPNLNTLANSIPIKLIYLG